MREILFRGKAANREDYRVYRTPYKNGDWVYGLLTDKENYLGFAEMTNESIVRSIEVDKNTIEQYTGLTDKNGKKIFEGDILKGAWETIFQVVYDDCYLGFRAKEKDGMYNCIDYYGLDRIEVIGNIHDNPELLESENTE